MWLGFQISIFIPFKLQSIWCTDIRLSLLSMGLILFSTDSRLDVLPGINVPPLKKNYKRTELEMTFVLFNVNFKVNSESENLILIKFWSYKYVSSAIAWWPVNIAKKNVAKKNTYCPLHRYHIKWLTWEQSVVGRAGLVRAVGAGRGFNRPSSLKSF